MIDAELWERIKFEYVHSNSSYGKLGKKYGIPKGTIGRVAAEQQWSLLRNAERAETAQKIISEGTSQTQILSAKYDAAEALMESTAKAHEKLNQLLNLDEPLAPRDIKAITGALFDLKALYGVRSEDEHREIEARIRKLQKECEEKSPADNTITVVFGNEDEVISDA